MTADAVVIDERDTPQTLLPPVEIIRAAKAGDGAAFEEVMRMTERRVAQIAWSILGDADDVKDAVQETFLRLFRHLKRYDETRDLTAWVTRIAVNVCRDLLRGRKKHRHSEPLDDALPSHDTRADEELAHRRELVLLGRAIETLPAKERLAVILREVEGLRTEEVAAALGSSVSTVRVQISRARAKLRRLIEAWRGGAR
jgi:RNA polymerase sigma-70 factor (ECF subfamily)